MNKVSIQDKQFLPGDQPIRTGATQVVPYEHFDTVLYGYGQRIDPQKGLKLFQDQNRCQDQFLCSIERPREFSNDIEFHAKGFACQVEFSDPSLYEIFVYYTQLRLVKQKAEKNLLWVTRMGAGGGIGGPGDQNTTSFHLGNGEPNSRNYYRAGIPWVFPAGKTWEMVLAMMYLVTNGSTGDMDTSDARQPVNIMNADIGGEEETRKLVRQIMIGTQFEDVTNT